MTSPPVAPSPAAVDPGLRTPRCLIIAATITVLSMANEREPRRGADRIFENEPSDEWQESYGRGGPVRSDEPERDYFFESIAAPMKPLSTEKREHRRMGWRAEGAQERSSEFDEQLVASHRGKGPKGYRPTDERLRERVCERLTDDPFVDATDIEVSIANGEISLSGSAETRRMKYAVEDVVAEVPGVTAVHNSIRVRRSI